ncbi:HaeIII family restriction endonuclease [Bacillus sp. RC92]|uniref:HaeIII family restriction endonuclease n=1 Tax=Bacillus sp. RC92 TaxID=3156293 RepID=UPI003836453E
MSQTTDRGYGFEYAMIERAASILGGQIASDTETWVNENGLLKYNRLSDDVQQSMTQAAERIANFLNEYEPWIQRDTTFIEHIKTLAGSTDVSDVRISSENKSIGVSLKSNHDAVKHPRVSPTIDVARQWLNIDTDQQYMSDVQQVFREFDEYRQQQEYTRFNEMSNEEKNHFLYRPISEKFSELLIRSFNGEQGTIAVQNILQYLIGDQDFYKAKADFRRREIKIEAFDFRGTLGTNRRLLAPTRCLEVQIIQGRSGMHNYINMNFDRGWEVQMRLHTADSRINNSLKWDVQFVGTPRDAWSTTVRF